MHVMRHEVHLSDTDCTGWVYYAKPLEWLEWCRVDWFNKKFGNFLKFVEETGITFFPSKVTVDYKKGIFFGDKIQIEMKPKEIKKVSFVLEYVIKRGEETVLTSEITLVCFDSKKKTFARLSDSFIEKCNEIV